MLMIGHGCDLRIWNDIKRAVAVAQSGFAQGHGFDDARDAGNVDGFAHVELVFEQNQDAVQHVAHDVLRGQADGDASNASRSQQRGKVDADRGQELAWSTIVAMMVRPVARITPAMVLTWECGSVRAEVCSAMRTMREVIKRRIR